MEQIDIRQELRAMTNGMAEWVEHRERSQRRWHRVARATIGVAAAVALLAIMAQPQPDGQYLSDPSYRAEALHSLDQACLASR
jgi:hypothetical protein